MTMKLYIKNMVCPRCIMAVQDILNQLHLKFVEVRLGVVLLDEEILPEQINEFRKRLNALGFELLEDSQQRIIEQIKSIVIDFVHYTNNNESNISGLLTTHLNKDYSLLSKLFSSTEGITIEQFMIRQRIERVKELLSYNEKTLSEIAFEMGYSSVAHLSAQFKKTTGLTPTQFKQQKILLRSGYVM